ncbi:MAG: UDP-N-acetylmuramate dehydrogenase [Candidatus Margulisbacteria bacterium]|nr:UDP-N-acetylmuramate dehydrogenase [Candidatus Margulisiibacteriota bacterium]
MLIKEHFPISNFTTFQNKGVIPCFNVLETIDEVVEFMKDPPIFMMVGKGSNIVINPEGNVRTIMQISPYLSKEIIENTFLTVGSGMSITRCLSLCQKYGLSGLEFAAGVPASIGGMVAMNFGCWGIEVGNIVSRVRVVKKGGAIQWLTSKECQFGYRTSIFQSQNWVVTDVQFCLSKSTPEDIQASIKASIKQRLNKQPLRDKTFGSIFKNPPGQHVGKLLEDLGYKGKQFQNVQLSRKHANFLLNTGKATFQDVKSVIVTIQEEVITQTGIHLKPEVHLVT